MLLDTAKAATEKAQELELEDAKALLKAPGMAKLRMELKALNEGVTKIYSGVTHTHRKPTQHTKASSEGTK